MMNEHFRERRDGMGGPVDLHDFSNFADAETIQTQETGTLNPADDVREHILIEQEGI